MSVLKRGCLFYCISTLVKTKYKDIVDTLDDPQDGEEISLTLKAKLKDGTKIEGMDCVLIKIKENDNGSDDSDSDD